MKIDEKSTEYIKKGAASLNDDKASKTTKANFQNPIRPQNIMLNRDGVNVLGKKATEDKNFAVNLPKCKPHVFY